MAEIDHIVIGARTLEEGARYIEDLLGVKPSKGGVHPGAGTHNMLLGMGANCFLEVIAPDPAQPEPAHPRPFDLDDASLRTMLEAEPRLIAYVASTPALDAVVARLGASHAGEMRAMSRGNLSWRMAFPPQRQDMDNLIPPLIQWNGERAAKHIRDFRLAPDRAGRRTPGRRGGARLPRKPRPGGCGEGAPEPASAPDRPAAPPGRARGHADKRVTCHRLCDFPPRAKYSATRVPPPRRLRRLRNRCGNHPAGRYRHTLAGGTLSGVQASRLAVRPRSRQGSGEVTQ